MTISIGIGLGILSGRVSPVSSQAPGGPTRAPYLTSITDGVSTLVIDAVVTATPTHKAVATKYPREKGLPITDSVQPEPTVLTMDCVISNTPLVSGGSRIVFSRGIAIPSSSIADAVPGEPGFAEDAYAWLVDIVGNPREVTVDRRRARYEHMVITSVSEPETAQNGDGLRFTLELQEISTVNVKKTAKQVTLGQKKKAGKVEAKPAAPAPDIDPAKRALAALGGLLGP